MNYHKKNLKYQKKEKSYKHYLHLSYSEILQKLKINKEYLQKLKKFILEVDKWKLENKKYNDFSNFEYDYLQRKLFEELEEIDFKIKKMGWGLFKPAGYKENLLKSRDELSKKCNERLKRDEKEHQEKVNEFYKLNKRLTPPALSWGKIDLIADNPDDIQRAMKNKSKIEEALPHIVKAQEIIKNKFNKEQSKNLKIQKEVNKHKAHSYAHQNKTRELAEQIKKEIKSQLIKFRKCPYCENDLGETPHADHIYPVSKGGLSTVQNMVYICKNCNLIKSDKTLNSFIKIKKLDRNKIESILNTLGKDC